jgi:uncharacterized protein YndB with AHSA1/START domain
MPAITIETIVNAPIDHVWKVWNEPEHITKWAFASDDWHAPRSENDLKVGGKFSTTMSAKDGSVSFDFGGVYTAVKTNELIEYDMDDQRHVKIQFEQLPEGVRVIETFDMESTNSEELQRGGWQAILENFKKRAESTK